MPAFQLANGFAPKKGPLGFTDKFVLGTANAPVRKIYTLTEMREIMDIVQAMWIDNSQNGELLIISVQVTEQVLRIPRYWQGTVPIYTILPLEMYAISNQADITIPYMLLNMPQPIGGWAAV